MSAEMVSFDERIREGQAARTHCTYCGRALIDVVELSQYDPKTGEPDPQTWRQCPRFPRNSWQAIFRGRPHESFWLGHEIARQWR
jgi:hypothetical protein